MTYISCNGQRLVPFDLMKPLEDIDIPLEDDSFEDTEDKTEDVE